jgi:aromatic-amino-acid transaminase
MQAERAGVYFGDDGKIPLLTAVKAAEKARLEAQPPRGYQPIEGTPAYNGAVQNLLFGKDSGNCSPSGRAITCQCLGGTGALKVGADYLKRLLPDAKVYISDPELGKPPRAVRGRRLHGRELRLLRCRHARRRLRRHEGRAGGHAGQVHRRAARLLPQPDRRRPHCRAMGRSRRRGEGTQLVAFVDMAYQGFADGIKPDAAALDLFAASGLQFFVSSSVQRSRSRSTASASAP